MKLEKNIVEDILMHPDWPFVEKYIEEYFDNNLNITAIDASKDSSVVHAEVIASQKVDTTLKSLMESFRLAKKSYKKQKTTYE